MSAAQSDLFAAPAAPSDEILAIVRARLHAALTLVQGAATMPWAGQLAWIREDNAFRYGVSLLPQAEGAALWAQFDAEMDRLYAVVNEGKEPDPGD